MEMLQLFNNQSKINMCDKEQLVILIREIKLKLKTLKSDKSLRNGRGSRIIVQWNIFLDNVERQLSTRI